ncbi:Na(+)-translocating NADH-quinone reductase subunit A [Polystyrenella longa]|uniref:Na(+)-translocating NADH-quinone reductase subunit A n=1 Tax=Polystyrenella longa TaxID=2528007 RepID=A0A518CRN1_9PLAN|nr:Na(+)-translocating NADH-quinone reductase subunit A [Polystyrenella longa]QDU81870.1 Na(+)-translocating NADH-quinone reductase subunit A [Polystyrenella longa]
MITISKGVRLPIEGEPKQEIQDGAAVTKVALIAADYYGMKPTMAVVEGDMVKKGDLLFTDKKTDGVCYTAPASGKVIEVNRGAKRVFQSIVIEKSGNEFVKFESYPDVDLLNLESDKVRDLLVKSGMWTVLRTRPYSRVPAIDSKPRSIFVTAIDTHPLAPNPEIIIGQNEMAFLQGMKVLCRLTDGKVFLCRGNGKSLPGAELNQVEEQEFAGPHPAGLPGTHIHFLDPASEDRVVWHVDYQNVIAIGRLFTEGVLSSERVISLAGPSIKNPRLIRTEVGACLSEVVADELQVIGESENRVIAGSVFGGRTAAGPFNYLGRFHNQVTVLPEGSERLLLGWQDPGLSKFSVTRAFASALRTMDSKLPFTTSTHGSKRAMVPIGSYEKVMPLDILPTQLLRSIIIGDTEDAKALGCLELDEEDLALCTFVCPGKYEYGPLLRSCLVQIEKEG